MIIEHWSQRNPNPTIPLTVIALFYFQHIHLWAKSQKHQHVKTGGFNFRSSWPCHGHIFKGRGQIQIFRSGHYAKSLVMWCIKGVGSNHVEIEQKKLYVYIADMAEWSKSMNRWLSDCCCSVSMLCFHIPSRENKKIVSSKI